jgi:hypothetical protein
MPLWGRNDQSVTANSTTTRESTTGAPIGTWALVKGSGNGDTPISMDANAHFGNTSPGSRASVDVALFDNTTPGAFISKMATGVFGVDANEEQVNRANGRTINHAGWVFRRAGTGSIITLSVSGSAAVQNSFSNSDTISIASPESGGTATGTVVTNSVGSIISTTITNAGYGFTALNNSANVTLTTSTGSNSVAIITATAGGRAGRVQYETLVAMGSLGAQTAAYGTPASVADANDDSVLPNA